MKKRTVALIVVLALVAVGAIGFVAYKNWSAIRDLMTFTPKSSANVDLPIVNPPPARPQDANTILQSSQTNDDLVKEREHIRSKGDALTVQKNTTIETAIKNINKEGVAKQAQAGPLSNIVVENTKQRAAKAQKQASDAYRDILKRIEIEKSKAAIVLTGTRTEKEKTAKLNALDVDALDMELELFAENRIRPPCSRRPFSKSEMEYLVHKQVFC